MKIRIFVVILVAILCLLVLPQLIWAQAPVDFPFQDHTDNSQSEEVYAARLPSTSPLTLINQDQVELTSKEKQALALSAAWESKSPLPIQSGKGQVLFIHGVSLPTIITAPLHVTDIELQAGEELNAVVIGDSARWLMDIAKSGRASSKTVHLLIKPVDSGQETSAVITTDRRTYHIQLKSQQPKKGYMSYVGFAYQEEFVKHFEEKQADEEREKRWNTTTDGIDLSNLNFEYTVDGDASWKPSQVYDNGLKTFISLPKTVTTSDMPVLLVQKGDANVFVNYRVKNNTFIVDGIFPDVVLVSGVGRDQERIEITRN